MKRLIFVLTIGAALACPAFAQTTNTPPPGPPPDGFHHHDHGMGFLTDAEKAELKKAHDAAVDADPTLAAEDKSIKEAMEDARESGTPPTDEEKQQWHDYRDKLNAAMLKADPAVAPILEKIKAHHHGPGGPGGPDGGAPPAPPAQ